MRFPFSPYQAVPASVQRDQRHAYYAAISYVDEHIGVLLARLRSENLHHHTIVLMHGDHGYHVSLPVAPIEPRSSHEASDGGGDDRCGLHMCGRLLEGID